jgi:hypothetical protein
VSDPVAVDTPPAPPRADRRRRITRLAGGLAGVLAVLLGIGAWQLSRDGTEVEASRVPASWARPVVDADGLGEASGVLITRVAVTGGGGLVDLRFKVVDPDRANALHDARTPPAVVDEQTGLVVHDLLMNHAHSGPYHAGVTYYLVFNNPGNWVHRGSRVTVLLGDAQVEHVKVA